MERMKISASLWAFALVLVLVLSSLSGCSNTDNESSSANESSSVSENSSTDETSASDDSSDAEETSAADENTTVDDDDDSLGYVSRLFDQSYVHTIEIEISEEDWTDLKANPTEKTKYETTVTVDGEVYESVSFATKGNTSLTEVASTDSDRYAFKLNFGKFEKGQTYHGLKKINLSNIYADPTYMKDYLSYEIFREAGCEAPLTSYVWLMINGEDWGLYLAIEEVADSFLERNELGEGALYKPESDNLDFDGNDAGGAPDGGQAGNQPGGDQSFPSDAGSGQEGSDQSAPSDAGSGQEGGDQSFPSDAGSGQEGQQGGFPGGGQNGGFPGGDQNGGFPGGAPDMNFGGADGGASLKYTDDEISSYSAIFDNAETDETEEDEQAVIAALKALSERTDLEDYLDTDEIIRYFVGHNFVMNYDSYTGGMLHNYYLYMNDGKLYMFPWDYNLAFGAFNNSDDATELVNYGIDTPLSGSTLSDRPMWAWIAEDETYLDKYHEVYNELLTNYFESGEFEEKFDAIVSMIAPYVEKDPNAFYTYEEFETATENLKSFCSLRAESIRKQLDGTLSTSTDEQNSADQVDASSVDMSAMGGMNHGNNGPGGSGEEGGQSFTPPEGEQSFTPPEDGPEGSQETESSTNQ